MLRLLIATLLCLGASASAQGYETRRITLVHDGLTRSAILDAAPGLRDAPALVALHGGIGSASWIRRRAGVTLAARGWAVLWPEAVDDWNDGRRDADDRPYAETDDVGFLRALVQGLAENGLVDPERVYVAGPSFGGAMTLRALCDAPDLVAGVAVAISALPAALDCPADGPPRPALFIHGTEDAIIPERGGQVGGGSLLIRNRGGIRSAAETAALLAARNACDGFEATPLPDRAPDDGSTVELRRYRGCAAPFLHYVVDGGGHSWPGAPLNGAARLFVGETNMDFSATAAIEQFFEGLAARD
jgi:polyhydroxybutyrate depolymerase